MIGSTSQQVVFAVLVAMSLLVAPIAALNCYSCTGCDGKGTLTDTDSCLSCAKSEATGGVITRACMPTAMTVGCTDVETEGVSGTICYCDSDSCNGAMTVAGSSSIVVATVMAAIVTKLMMQ
jgi:hypothetical protein